MKRLQIFFGIFLLMLSSLGHAMNGKDEAGCSENTLANVPLSPQVNKAARILIQIWENGQEAQRAHQPKFRCDFPGCSITSNHRGTFNRHQRTHTADKLMFKCTQCTKKFSRNYRLTAHIANVHKK